MENDKLVRASDIFPALQSAGIPYNYATQRVIEQLPAVDAVEVRHGRWEGNYPQAMFRLKRCSVCETLAPEGWYCFFCGAMMDGEEVHNALD